MILKHYVFDMRNFRINFTVPRDKSRGHPLHKAPCHRNFVQRPHLDPTGLMKARLAVLVPGKSIPWIWIWFLQLRFSSISINFRCFFFFKLLINLYSICWVRLKPHVSNVRRCWDMRGEEVGHGAAFWWFSHVFPAKPPILQSFVRWFWVNYNELTTSSLEIIVSKGNHPQMAQLFRLVNYYNLPRWLLASFFVTIFVFPGDRWVFLLRLGNHQPTIRRYFLGPSRSNPCGWGMRNVRTSQIQVGPSWDGKGSDGLGTWRSPSPFDGKNHGFLWIINHLYIYILY